MNQPKYKATLSGEQSRSGLCLIFRHPLRKNPDGSSVRVRRGLGTKVKADALRLVDQMNEILGDPVYWTPQTKTKAESRYDERIVNAFYDQLLPVTRDYWALRGELIPLPGPDQGYVRARFLGTTGSGKTTLLRQIIGTHPATERFPSTSTAKTTVCDIEVITVVEENFQGVVTFFPREQVRLLIEECALAAATAVVFEAGKMTSPATRLLEHGEQRFRLNYVLGNLVNADAPAQEDDEADEDDADVSEAGEHAEVNEDERRAMSDQIRDYLSRIEVVARDTSGELQQDLGVVVPNLERQELDSFQELFEDTLRQREEFHGVVDDILEAVESRFEALDPVGLRRDRGGWPLLWQFETADRAEFIRTINRFSSNYAPNFGKLLTPLVQGIRVEGPFRPEWVEESECKLVLMDGEGLGHTPESSASISTSITQHFGEMDAIVLVDSAAQPMQAGPQALLRTLAASGHEGKLVVCFTHFDEVKGDNLPDLEAKQQHVLRSMQNAIGGMREVLGRSAENALGRAVDGRTFFVANIHEPLKGGARKTRGELQRLLGAIRATITPPVPTTAHPVYDVANLILCIPKAMEDFREPWRARLNLPSRSNLSPEHWARIKALSRRFAELGQIEYKHLHPVADFILCLSERISVFLSSPIHWEPVEASEEMKRQVTDEVARQVFAQLHILGSQRLFHERLREWEVAYSHRSTGSAGKRAHDIEGIYNAGAPIPGEAGNPPSSEFVAEITRVVSEAVHHAGGKFGGHPGMAAHHSS